MDSCLHHLLTFQKKFTSIWAKNKLQKSASSSENIACPIPHKSKKGDERVRKYKKSRNNKRRNTTTKTLKSKKSKRNYTLKEKTSQTARVC